MLYLKLKARLLKAKSVAIAALRNQTTMYPDFVVNFEKDFARYVERDLGVSFCNGTSSLEAALFALGIKEGDEVLVSSFTFHATFDTILNSGAKPVFVDADPDTFTMDLKDAEEKITDKTKCIMPTHFFGNPADMDAIKSLAEKHNLKIIDDCSHAHGAKWDGKKIGSLSDISCFSLAGMKPIAAGEGGIAVTNDRHYYERMVRFGHFSRDEDKMEIDYYSIMAGTGSGRKMRANPMGIALAAVDLKMIDCKNKEAKTCLENIREVLSSSDVIIPQKNHDKAVMGGFFSGATAKISDKVMEKLTRAEVLDILNSNGVLAVRYQGSAYHKNPYLCCPEYHKKVLYNVDLKEIEHNVEIPSLPVAESLSESVIHIVMNRNFTNRRKKALKAALQEIENKIK